MAVTKVLSRSMRPDQLISYVANPIKTEEHTLVSCFNCELETAAKRMLETKARWGKEDGIGMFHGIQSFDPGEVSPEEAHEIGAQFVQEHFSGYEVVLATHIDKDHIHNHLAVNSVNALTGKKYHSTAESYYVQVRGTSDRLCREHGLSVIDEPKPHALSYAEWRARKNGMLTLREQMDLDTDEVLSTACSVGDIYRMMEARGYVVEHNSKYPTFRPAGAKNGFRMRQCGKALTEDELESYIDDALTDTSKEVIIKQREYVPYKPLVKPTGFIALVYHWMYVLGIIGQGKQTDFYVDPKDVLKFEQLKRQAEFLEKYAINDFDALDARETVINAEMDRLTKSRIILNSKKKRNRKLYDALAKAEYLAGVPEEYTDERAQLDEARRLLEGRNIEALDKEKTEVYDGLVSINKSLRELRGELKLISALREDIPHIEKKVREANRSRSILHFQWER